MFSLLMCDKLPFKTVLLHPIVRDAYGRKISKSLGNGKIFVYIFILYN